MYCIFLCVLSKCWCSGLIPSDNTGGEGFVTCACSPPPGGNQAAWVHFQKFQCFQTMYTSVHSLYMHMYTCTSEFLLVVCIVSCDFNLIFSFLCVLYSDL